MLGLAVAPALVFGTGMFFLPETPRWLIHRGRHEVAHRVLVRIRDVADVNIEIEEIKTSLAQQTESGRWTDLLRRQVRPALVVGLGLAVFQQITGINTVIYYAPKILQAAGFNSASGAILATAGVGVVNVSMTIVAMFLVDRAGRRPLLLVGIAGMIVTLGALGLSFRISNPSGHLAWIAISLGPIFWLLIAEIYPLRIRGLAEGAAATFNWGSNLIVSLTFLTLLEKLGASATFLLYAFASVASWLFAYYLVPETKGRTLEEIEAFWRARHGARRTAGRIS
jgi:sugar porter (SP) family MFS transporter